METGIELIAKERKEQIEKHGRTVEQDSDENPHNQLAMGAEALICDAGAGDYDKFPNDWSENICTKMMEKNYKERLIIAGALIAAEIDRLNFNNE